MDMQNRRDFFKTVAGAAAVRMSPVVNCLRSAQRGGGGGAADAVARRPRGPVARKEISIGGKRVTVIDVHSHCTVDGVAEVVKGTPFERQAGGRALGADRIAPDRRRRDRHPGADDQRLLVVGGPGPRRSPGASSARRTRGWRKWCPTTRIASSR